MGRDLRGDWISRGLIASIAMLLPCSVDVPEAHADSARPSGAIDFVFFGRASRPAVIFRERYRRLKPAHCWLRISLKEQRAYLMTQGTKVIITPISSGRRESPTPTGVFHVMEKEIEHRSNLYGDLVDARGHLMKRHISSRSDRPPGAFFQGIAMPYWQRLTEDGVGLHAGPVSSSPMSRGCIRFPLQVMKLIYAKTQVGTTVLIEN